MILHPRDDTEPAIETCLSRAVRAALPAVLVLVFCTGLALSPTLFSKVVSCKQWFLEEQLHGVFCFTMMFSVSMAVLLPYTPFCIATGYIWGFTSGMIMQFLAIFVSSGLIYGIGRAVSPTGAVYSWGQNRKWTNLIPEIDRDWRHAAKLNFILCFVPMPYGVHAYIFALSQHSFLTFVAVFEFGMVPNIILNLKIGSLLASRDETNAHTLKTLGIVVSVCVLVCGTLVGGLIQGRLNLGSDLQPEDEVALVCTDHETGENVIDPVTDANVLPYDDCLVDDPILV